MERKRWRAKGLNDAAAAIGHTADGDALAPTAHAFDIVRLGRDRCSIWYSEASDTALRVPWTHDGEVAVAQLHRLGLIFSLVCLVAGLAVASPAGAVVVSMGDSYSSGEGAGPFDEGTGGNGNTCHRSVNAWPRLSGVPKRAHLACSGAKTRDFFYGKTTTGPDKIGQLDQLRAIAKREKITRVLIGVGGNDLGFGQIMRDCFLKDCLKRMDAVELPRLRGVVRSDVARVLRLAHQASGNAEVVLVGYPNAIPAADKPFTGCGWLTDQEKGRVWRLQDELDRVLRSAADDGGAYYVSIARSLEGHELCTTDSWMRPLGTARVLPVQQQGHPNRDGQYAINRAVRAGLEAQKIYFSSTGSDIQSIAVRSANRRRTTVVTDDPSRYVTAATVLGSRLYWSNRIKQEKIGSVIGLYPPLTSPSLVGEASEPYGLVVLAGQLWWADNDGVHRAPLDGGSGPVLAFPLPPQVERVGGTWEAVNDLTTDGRYLFALRGREGEIVRIDPTAGTVQRNFIRLPASLNSVDITSAGGYLYFSGWFDQSIGRARTNGTQVQPVWIKTKKGITGPSSLVADSQYIYFFTYPNDYDGPFDGYAQIGRVFRDGTAPNYSIVTGLTDAGLLELGTS